MRSKKPAETIPLVVEVTLDDIAQAITCSCSRCPLALAIARTLAGDKPHRCSVQHHDDPQSGSWWTFMFRTWDRRITGTLPQEVGWKAAHYDITGKMLPFTFTVEAEVL